MKGIYLCAREHRIPGYDIDYNDIVAFSGIDIVDDLMNVDVSKYDYIIATPPCNYYSHANWRRDTSRIAQSTKHLLPYCLDLCLTQGKPFLIENVMNSRLLPKAECYQFDFGQHHFYTNVFMLIPDKSFAVRQNKQYTTPSQRDGNYNVDFVIRLFLERIGA